ncbi:RNA-binding protein [candidate division MSBL1 archaeon SCGC-AAA259I09]|uniref:DNA/RNA-binding protein Alba n=2 Tax=candidate division MSBL1 TaxID=215777 RepID=A0A133UTU6_9EURY|nr:RNA-binding protein [candidate division MSBL1 archaeon SCGC-AAA259D14]KXA97625.1 RNA-binding protein [candidate division MSBL1 archaeon SCGC-AAA259I09]
MSDDNVVYVGSKKGPMDYVLAVVTQFNRGSEDVVLKARGGAIGRAVDTAEITKNRFMQNLEILDITTGTEELENEDGSASNVSSISITLGESN